MPNMNDAPREVMGTPGNSGSPARAVHTMVIVAAGAVTLFCAIGIGVMTGLIPSAFSGPTSATEGSSSPPSATVAGVATAAAGSVSDAALPDIAKPPVTDLKPIESKTFGQPGEKGRVPTEKSPLATTTVIASQPPAVVPATNSASTPAYNLPAAPPITVDVAPAALCRHCGTVDSITPITKAGEGSGAGAVLGGLIGGVLGHQAGSGRGKEVATVAGAVGGAVIGHQIEKSNSSTTAYDIRVRLEDGSFRTVRYERQPDLRLGDKVRMENGRLVRGG